MHQPNREKPGVKRAGRGCLIDHMEKLPVYILAGGKSSRFGSDKARAMLSGKPLVAHVAESLKPFASQPRVVADAAGKYDDLGLRTLGDEVPDAGPLGGLLTALRDCDQPWLLLVPCDFLGIQQAWIERLFQAPREGYDAVVFRHEFRQPMPGLYHASIAPRIERQLAGPDRSLMALLDSSRVLECAAPDDWPKHPGINTRGELDAYAP